MESEKVLDDLRKSIDAIDRKLLVLLNDRASLAKEVGEFKRNKNGEEAAFYKPDRESLILNKLTSKNQGPIPNSKLEQIMKAVISVCRSLEKELKVGYLGPKGTFTHLALLNHFTEAVSSVGLDDIPAVFKAVESDSCDYGVVPVENSQGGSVSQTLDSLIDTSLVISGELELPIRHQMLSKAKDLDAINTVFAHSQALMQCKSWLKSNIPNAELVGVSSNAQAAIKACKNSAFAAIASDHAASIYDLNILRANIEDSANNSTRFIVMGKHPVKSTGRDRTSILFSLQNKSGSLNSILQVLADAKISMSRIESKPAGRSLGEYLFFVDFLGHRDNSHITKALDEMESKTAMLKILGSYPVS